jgi:hypothetical protein
MRNRKLPLLLLAALLAPASARAQALGLLVQLNGSPKRLGTMTSAGSSTTIAVKPGIPLLVVCDAKAHVGVQATCHATIDNANYCAPQVADEKNYFIPNGATVAMIPNTGSAKCTVFELY